MRASPPGRGLLVPKAAAAAARGCHTPRAAPRYAAAKPRLPVGGPRAAAEAAPPHERSAQSERFGTKIFSETVTSVDLSKRPFKVVTSEKEARSGAAQAGLKGHGPD